MGLGAPRCCPRMSVCCEASVLRAACYPMSPLSPCAVRRHAMGAAAHLGPHPALSLAGPTEMQSSHSQPHSAANCGSWEALAQQSRYLPSALPHGLPRLYRPWAAPPPPLPSPAFLILVLLTLRPTCHASLLFPTQADTALAVQKPTVPWAAPGRSIPAMGAG